MKLLKLALSLLLLSPISIAQATSQPHPLESHIDAVNIYSNGAFVHRSIDIDLPAGQHRIAIAALPSDAVQENYQLSPAAQWQGINIQELSFSIDSPEEPLFAEQEQDIAETQKQIDRLNQKQTVSQQQWQFAQNLAQSFTKNFGSKDQSSSSIPQAQETWTFLQETLEQHQQTSNELAEEKAALQKKLHKQKKELQKKEKQARATAGLLQATLSSDSPIKGQLTLSTFHRQASWQASYEIHSHIDASKINIRIFANIRQNTPEDWSEIHTTLHAQAMNQFDQIPELHPIRLSPKNTGYSKFSSSRSISTDAFIAEDAMFSKEPAPNATYQSQGNSFTATLSQPLSIPRDNERVQVLIDQNSTQASYWTTATPRLNTQAYLLSETKNPFAFPLLAGQATIFLQKDLVGTVALPYTLAQEKMELTLGRDPNITITRTETKKFQENSGLIDKTTTLERAYLTEVSSNYNTPHRVTIHDQFPLTANGKITVKPLQPKTKDIELDEDTGLFHWDLTLSPQSKKTLQTSFEVTYPRDWQLRPQL